MKLYGSITNNSSISGTINSAGDISGALSNPLAKGASAYDIAVANGFVGTETQWLESLQGRTPQRGVDYWTVEDIAQLKKEFQSQMEEEIRKAILDLNLDVSFDVDDNGHLFVDIKR